MATYNTEAIQAAIDRDPAIGKAEARAIHALLRGRTKAEPEVEVEVVHTCGGPVFGRLAEHGCGRCDELRDGAAPRQGWNRRSRYDGVATAAHNCSESNCAIVCTFGDF